MSAAVAQEGPAEKAKDTAADTAKTVAKAPKKVANALADAAAQKITVSMTEFHFNMPATAKSGKTTFLIKNAGRKEHTFEIKGEGIDQKLSPSSSRRQSMSATGER